MFSVDDSVMRHNWTVSLKRQIDIASAGQQAQAVIPSPSFPRPTGEVKVVFRTSERNSIEPRLSDLSISV
jgi:hypothetical protein